jgi:hypothetical protein
MDLAVHRAMLHYALQRAGARNGQKLDRAFHGLWLGNWPTDMNQATLLFDAAQARLDPYDRWRASGTYVLPDAVRDNAATWTSLFQALWAQEWRLLKAPGPESPGCPIRRPGPPRPMTSAGTTRAITATSSTASIPPGTPSPTRAGSSSPPPRPE